MTEPAQDRADCPKPRVLLVEDEALIRMVVAEELRDVGFCVLECADASEALEICASGSPVDLLITDVQMPGPVDGLALARMLKSDRLELPVIIMSGHLRSIDADGIGSFLRKPVPLEVLTQLAWALVKAAERRLD